MKFRRLAAYSFLLLAACGGGKEDPRLRAEVTDLVRRYTDRLPDVYEKGDPDLLSEYATVKERVEIRKLIRALEIRGYRLRATMREFKITYVDVFNGSSAYVRTEERWDVVSLDAKSGEEISRDEGQTLHVVYQLQKFIGEGWRVTARIVDETKRQREIVTP